MSVHGVNLRAAESFIGLSLIGLIIRRALWGAMFFPGEILSEDVILVLILAFWLAPSKFKPVIWYAMGFATNATKILITTLRPLLPSCP